MNEFAHKRTWGPKPNYPRVLNYKPPNNKFILISGPCSVESEDQIRETAKFVKSLGATHLRGGLYRAGTYPPKSYGFIDESLIKAFADAAWSNGLKTVIEVLDYTQLSTIIKYADCFQVGARQTQNYNLLKIIGKSDKQIFLKRNMGMTIDEWLGACEYLLESGPCEPVLIERGSSTYHTDVRWTPTLHTIPSVKSICNVPIVFDPSHSTGRRDMVKSMALAGTAAGADGLLLEVHKTPELSISDSEQAIDFETYKNIINKVNTIRSIL